MDSSSSSSSSEANLRNLNRQISQSPPSPPDFLSQVQAAFKRHRPHGTMQSNNIMPKRSVCLPRRETSKSLVSDPGSLANIKKSCDVVLQNNFQVVQDFAEQKKNCVGVIGRNQEDTSITQPSLSCTTKNLDENFNIYNSERDQPKPASSCKQLHVEHHQHENQKKVQFSVGNNTTRQGANDVMATGSEILSSYVDSLTLTEMEWDASNQAESSTVLNRDQKHQTFQSKESEVNIKSDGTVSSLLAKRTMAVQEQLHQFKNFLNHPVTQSSVAGSSCPTTTSVHSMSAPMLNSTTYLSQPCQDGAAVESSRNIDKESQPLAKKDIIQSPCLSDKDTCRSSAYQPADEAQPSTSATDNHMKAKESNVSLEKDVLVKPCLMSKGPSLNENMSSGKAISGDVTNVQSQAPVSRSSFSDMKTEAQISEKPEKQEKNATGKGTAVSRKRNYDPDLFFKVNGKPYQRLGKIGSGGSSEVHKVISSDCKIYALKKIKLKGRDYATAYGFCQEIEYLNRLKGKKNIIQLIDYEVTDKALLQEVLNGSMSNKDGRVRDDGYIYMVLEYGEIDLAHMLSQKWKEMEGTGETIDDNWLRFYWQQILLAVNTIHEERIVHSDLKPANFLLVRGSLKLIDFGIAKAIMSDTTNIQRDAQVGTLSYMSPEAFMCNENDADGNIIKCGRPSDIWSLGCILYQMVYGRTPFSDYKTFWAKFKVITDPNHEIKYEPISNPWLLDLMKKCLAWDRNQRWRIPQLLQHPFLNPPVLLQLPSSHSQSAQLLQCIAEACGSDREASMLCFQVQQLLTDPVHSTSRDQQCALLSQVSKLFFRLQERLAN